MSVETYSQNIIDVVIRARSPKLFENVFRNLVICRLESITVYVIDGF